MILPRLSRTRAGISQHSLVSRLGNGLTASGFRQPPSPPEVVVFQPAYGDIGRPEPLLRPVSFYGLILNQSHVLLNQMMNQMNESKDADVAPFGALGAAVDHLTAAFEDAGLENARESARILVCRAVGVGKLELLTSPSRKLSGRDIDKIKGFMLRRLAREPVTRIEGQRDFWTVTLEIRPGVLDPRADTERLVEVSLSNIKPEQGQHQKILDVGIGSGAILCALLMDLPNATGVGIDISTDACEAAEKNLSDLNLAFRSRVLLADFSTFAETGFDLVVANPPYIRSEEIAALDPEVADYDPVVALDGGADGLDAYRVISARLPIWLKPNGFFALEIGHDQAAPVIALLREAGLQGVTLTKDYNGLDRVVSGTKAPI